MAHKLAEAQAEAAARAQAAAQQAAAQQAAAKAQAEAAKAQAEAAAKAAWDALPRHKVGVDETLSAIALKHYGHATEPYWRVIYEANKAAIGNNPGVVRPGTELVIPNLPAELKK